MTEVATINAANLELNKGDDFIVALDISGSMQANDCPGGMSRTAYSLEQFKTFATEAAKWDTDGVSVYGFGVEVHQFTDVAEGNLEATIQKVKSLPYEGATMTHKVIEAAYAEHKKQNNEQTVLLLFTDGEPSDQTAVFSTIAKITNEVKDEREFNISFITVGQRSSSLDQFLTKLDDAIPGAKYDVVDVKKLEEVDFYKAFDGALND